MVPRKFRQAITRCALAIVCALCAFNAVHGASSDGYYIVDCMAENVGQMETHGANRSPFIDAINKLAGVPVGSFWCASTVNYSHVVNGFHGKGAYCPNWFKKKDIIYQRGKINRDKPRPGDCFGIWHPDKKRVAHMGVVEQYNDKYTDCIEGNGNAKGSRNGNQQLRKRRYNVNIYAYSRHYE